MCVDEIQKKEIMSYNNLFILIIFSHKLKVTTAHV